MCFRCLIFLSQTAYIFDFYTVDYTCVICMRAVSLKIPISDLRVCMCILLNKMEDAKIPHLLLKDLAFFIMIQPQKVPETDKKRNLEIKSYKLTYTKRTACGKRDARNGIHISTFNLKYIYTLTYSRMHCRGHLVNHSILIENNPYSIIKSSVEFFQAQEIKVNHENPLRSQNLRIESTRN